MKPKINDSNLRIIKKRFDLIELSKEISQVADLFVESVSLIDKALIGIVPMIVIRKENSFSIINPGYTESVSSEEYITNTDLLRSDSPDHSIVTSERHTLHYCRFLKDSFLCFYYEGSVVEKGYLFEEIALDLAILYNKVIRNTETHHSVNALIVEDNDFIKSFPSFFSEVERKVIENTTNKYSALIYLDFERFSSAKEFIRFSFNDDILLKIKRNLRLEQGKNIVVAKVEHDILAILIKDISSFESMAFEYTTRLIAKCNRQLKEPIQIESNSVFLTFKAGIRLFKANEFTEDNAKIIVKKLLKQTEFAMDSVKSTCETPYIFFSDELSLQYNRVSEIEGELRLAMSRNEFQVFYQPIYDVKKDIVGAEALVRWNNKSLGWVSPAEFIPVAERCGLVIEIGNFVAEAVCKFLTEDNNNLEYISINISCIQLKHSLFKERMFYLLSKYPKAQSRLRCEITESVALHNLKQTRELMSTLIKRGVKFMLDDFGTGYSSLAYLHALPLHTIKVDKCFIDGVSGCKKKQAITNSIIGLAKSFGLDCIVEGVEEKADFEFLIEKRVTAFQGFLFSKPMTEEMFKIEISNK